jgi:hypothetical protein
MQKAAKINFATLLWVIATLLAISHRKFPSSPPPCPVWVGSDVLISHRLFQCACCHSLVRICTSCDRGQRFCQFPCAGQARRESTRLANKKYRESSKGRRRNRLRQRRYRQRRAIPKQIPNVTHQGSSNSEAQPKQRLLTQIEEACKSPKENLDAKSAPPESSKASGPDKEKLAGYHCNFCQSLCGHFARRDFLPPPKRSHQRPRSRDRNWNRRKAKLFK